MVLHYLISRKRISVGSLGLAEKTGRLRLFLFYGAFCSFVKNKATVFSVISSKIAPRVFVFSDSHHKYVESSRYLKYDRFYSHT